MALRSQNVPFSSDCFLFSIDSPDDRMTELAPWFDPCPISEIDRQKIGRDNARALFELYTLAHR
jgi:2,3-dihydroxybenzoate decarboxylase